MTYRQRDQRIYPEPIMYEMLDFNSGAVVYTQEMGPYYRNIGKYQDIESVDDGCFVKGEFRVNPVRIFKSEGSCTWGSFRHQETVNYFGSGALQGRYMSIFNDHSALQGQWDDELENASSQKALASLKEASAEIGVFLGEFTQTLRMLTNPFEAVKNFLKSPKTLRSVDLTAQLWLQYRYGIIPLIHDIEAIIKTLSRKMYREDKRLRRLKKGTSVTRTSETTMVTGLATCSFTVTTTTKKKVSSNTSIYFRVNSDFSKAYIWGLSLEQGPAIAWELVPYSFVIDWFLNVGNWLQAIQPTPQLEFVGGCTSQKTTYDVVSEPSDPYWGTPGAKVDVFYPSVYKWKSETLIRHVGIPTPVLPALNPSRLNLKRQLDSLALIWGQVKFRR